jgi:hypothetical protein
MVKGKIYEEFIIQKHPPIYNADQFAEFCHSAGAENIFNHILMSVTSERHSSSRQELNKRRTVCIIYKMCYCLSQLCNIMQVDHAIYLNSNNVNQEGMDTEFQLGNTCSRKTSNIKLNKLIKWSPQQPRNIFFWSYKEWMATFAHYWWPYKNPHQQAPKPSTIFKLYEHVYHCHQGIQIPQSYQKAKTYF